MLLRPYTEIVAELNQRIIGQPEAIARLERSLKIAAAGLRDADMPLAVLLFAGPTGTGKSETARVLAQAIHDDPSYLCRVDCNLLSESHTAASLTGSPPGYIGSSEGNTLLNEAVIAGAPGQPGILVFEEVEKAHPSVWDVLLGVFDKASLALNNGRSTIRFDNTIIILTSNLGARELTAAVAADRLGFASAGIAAARTVSDDERRGIVEREMKRVFRPEFINRLDDMVVFDWLGYESAHAITLKLLGQFKGKMTERYPQHHLRVEKSVVSFLVAKGFDVASGGRALKRAIRNHLEEPLAEHLVAGLPYEHSIIRVAHSQAKAGLTFRFEPGTPAIPQQAAPLALESATPTEMVA